MHIGIFKSISEMSVTYNVIGVEERVGTGDRLESGRKEYFQSGILNNGGSHVANGNLQSDLCVESCDTLIEKVVSGLQKKKRKKKRLRFRVENHDSISILPWNLSVSGKGCQSWK